MPRVASPLCLILLLLFSGPQLLADLSLKALIDGQTVDPSQVSVDSTDQPPGVEKKLPNPAVSLQLDGDLAQLNELALWSPAYSLRRAGVGESFKQPELRFLAEAGISHDSRNDTFGKPRSSSFLTAWPQGLDNKGILIGLWLCKGKVEALQWRIINPTDQATRVAFRLHFPFKLDAGQCAGQPVLLLWSNGAFIKPQSSFSPLAYKAFIACLSNDPKTLKETLASGLDVNSTNKNGTSLLHYAAEAGSLDCLRVLVQGGAKINLEDKIRFNALCYAASKNRVEALRLLLESRARVKQPEDIHPNPLSIASNHGFPEVVQALLIAGADTEAKDELGRIPLSLAIEKHHTDIAAVLLKAQPVMDFNSRQNRLAFLSACRTGNLETVKFFLDNGSSASMIEDDQSSLTNAAAKGTGELARLLLDRGAKINWRNSQNFTAIGIAVLNKNLDFARVLVERGAKLDLLYKNNSTVLHIACLQDDAPMLRMLLKADPQLDQVNSQGLSPLLLATQLGASDCVTSLLEKGARLPAGSEKNPAVLEAILRMDQESLLGLCLEMGLSPDYRFGGDWPISRVAELMNATRCRTVLSRAGVKEATESPCPVVSASALDAPPKPLHAAKLFDPRPESEEFPSLSFRLLVLLDSAGKLRFATTDHPIDPRLHELILQTLPSWEFTPPVSKSKPVAVRLSIPVNFPSSKEREKPKVIPDVLPVAIRRISPVYPYGARVNGNEASVVVSFTVSEQGQVLDPKVVQSSGQIFNEPALDAIRRWTFKPAMLKGKPIPFELQVPIVFNIVD